MKKLYLFQSLKSLGKIFLASSFFLFAVSTFGQAPESFDEMYNGPQRVITPTNTIKNPTNHTGSRPVTSTYTDRASFQAAAPGLVLEDLSGTPLGVITCGDLISSTNPSCYPPAELMPGFTLTSGGGMGGPTDALIAISDGGAGQTFNAFGSNFFADFPILSFPNNDVFAIGLDLFNTSNANLDIRVFGAGGALISTESAFAPNFGHAFFGIVADEVITKIEIQDPSGGGELIMNLEYGSAAPPPVPTLSQWGLIILALLMMSLVLVFATAAQVATPTGQTISVQNFAVNTREWMKTWAGVTLVTGLGFVTAMNVFGYELTSADPIGALVASAIVAYMITKMKK